KKYSGYITVAPNTYYFYWFFESRRDPVNDPVTVFISGGPGCTTVGYTTAGLGTCHLKSDNETVVTELSWNNVSNLLLIDQPTGAGFSYGGTRLTSTDAGAPLFYNALQGFLKKYPQYQKNDMRFEGQSYGGHFAPSYANYVVQRNLNLPAGNVHINLCTLAISNGLTRTTYQWYDMRISPCTYVQNGPLLSPADCKTLRESIATCVTMNKKCEQTGTNADCVAALSYCNVHIRTPSQKARGNSNETIHNNGNVVEYYNRPEIQRALGVAPMKYVSCTSSILGDYGTTGDYVRDYAKYVANVLNHGVKVLNGLFTFPFPSWYGVHAWTEALDFNGQADYRAQPLLPWHLDGVEVGQFKSGGNLTFIRVYEAGHGTFQDQPQVAFSLFNTTLNCTNPPT
ncbi:alpha/beta-hydrolase, partial [Hesseltinella vesiculosa]